MTMKKFKLLFASLVFISAAAFAQEDEDSEGSSDDGINQNLGPVFEGAWLSASAGPMYYQGDLAQYYVFPKIKDWGESFRSGYKVTLGRDIMWGLGAQFHFQKGSLKGTRQPGPQSTWVYFRSDFHDIGLSIKYDLNDLLFSKENADYRRCYLHGKAGFGMVWYRSQLFDRETNATKDYEGYIETEETKHLAQKTLVDKEKMPYAFTVPVGLKFGYRINHKADIFLDITLTNTFTDRLDAWSRSWTANDKYTYIGAGFTFNFNRDEENDKIKKRSESSSIDDAYEEDSESASSSDVEDKEGILASIFSGKKKAKKSASDDEVLNMKLKLFEIQLKLFEMQYMLEEE